MDNSSLLESVALFEGDLGKVADRHAQLIGHVNKKQKIRYTVKLLSRHGYTRTNADSDFLVIAAPIIPSDPR